jgi:hypothetical protein
MEARVSMASPWIGESGAHGLRAPAGSVAVTNVQVSEAYQGHGELKPVIER